MVSIDVRDACVNFPIFDAKSRSLNTALGPSPMVQAGGRSGTDRRGSNHCGTTKHHHVGPPR
jgi:hypothetical protein